MASRFHPFLGITLLLILLGTFSATRWTPAPLLSAANAAPDNGPWIFVYPGVIDVTHTNPPETTVDTITIENSGPDFIFYSLHVAADNCEVPDAPAWLLPGSGGGSLPPYSLDVVQVQISSDGLVNGVYNALLCIQDNTHPQNPYHQVFVQLTVAAPATETPTPKPPTETPEPPTATPEPPTATPEPPPPTPTDPPVPATETPTAPTATPKLPTATITPSNTPPPGASLTPTVPPPATNTPVVEATITTTPAPVTHAIYLPLARRR